MRFWNPFNYLPILGTYRLTYYKAVVLRAPPTVLRLCVLLEVLIAIGVFVVAYYYTATTATTETVVSFEVLGSDYTCTVLSPRSDTQDYDDTTSEIAAFSSARYDYSECTTALGPQGYNLCSDDFRKDYLLTMRGYGTETSDCLDLILAENYRLCKGSEEEFDFRTSELTLQFPTYPSATTKFSDQYFFMNSSAEAIFAGSFPTNYATPSRKKQNNRTTQILLASFPLQDMSISFCTPSLSSNSPDSFLAPCRSHSSDRRVYITGIMSDISKPPYYYLPILLSTQRSKTPTSFLVHTVVRVVPITNLIGES